MNTNKKTSIKYASARQVKFIKTVQRRHLPDDEYYEMLENRFGVASCKNLTTTQASELLQFFTDLRFIEPPKKKVTRKPSKTGKPRKKRSSGGNSKVIKLASLKEKQKIKALAALVNWKCSDGLSKWMLKHFGIVRVKSSHDAYLVIEGLKKVFERQMKKEHGADWWQMKFEDEHIQKYINYHCPEEYR